MSRLLTLAALFREVDQRLRKHGKTNATVGLRSVEHEKIEYQLRTDAHDALGPARRGASSVRALGGNRAKKYNALLVDLVLQQDRQGKHHCLRRNAAVARLRAESKLVVVVTSYLGMILASNRHTYPAIARRLERPLHV